MGWYLNLHTALHWCWRTPATRCAAARTADPTKRPSSAATATCKCRSWPFPSCSIFWMAAPVERASPTTSRRSRPIIISTLSIFNSKCYDGSLCRRLQTCRYFVSFFFSLFCVIFFVTIYAIFLVAILCHFLWVVVRPAGNRSSWLCGIRLRGKRACDWASK